MLSVLAIAVLWMGVYPKPFTDVMNVSVGELIKHVAAQAQAANRTQERTGHMNWSVVLPEIVLLTMACVVAMVDLFVTDPRRRVTYWLTQASFVVVAALHLWLLQDSPALRHAGHGGQRPMGHALAFFATVAMIFTVAYAQPYVASRDMLKGEFFTLAMFVLLGISVMTAANNFLMVYLGLELMSLSLYALTALRRDHAVATEAAMKYFVLGALASGFLLYGLSMMYGATGTLTIPDAFTAINSGRINKEVLSFGVVFVVAGLAFKLGVVPFHMWVPDVYHGAPTPVTLMIGGAPEFAAFAITIRLLVEGLSGLAPEWQQMLVVLSVASLVLGNLAAIAQSNLKRMLAYSTIGADGLHAAGPHAHGDRRQHAVGGQRLQLVDVLHRHLRADHARHLRPDHAAVAPGLRERGDQRSGRPRPARAVDGRRDDAA